MKRTKKGLERIKVLKTLLSIAMIIGAVGILFVAGEIDAFEQTKLITLVPKSLFYISLMGISCGIIYKIEPYEEMLESRLEYRKTNNR